MPELPLQSPARVGDIGAAAPAIVMSLKSQSVADTAAAVIVLDVPIVSEYTAIRFTALAPATVRVPVTVWFADNAKDFNETLVELTVRFAKVFAPVMMTSPVAAPEPELALFVTLLKVKPPPAKVAGVTVIVI